MITLQHLAIGFIASFIGSLPLGVLNLTVMDIAINKRFRDVVYFSVGAAGIEFFQALLAVKFSAWFLDRPSLDLAFNIIVIPIFLGLSIYYFRKSRKSLADKKSTRELSSFHKGVLLSVINPLAIPFWIFYATYFNSLGLIILENYYIVLFVAGIAAGTFIALLVFGKVSRFIVSRIKVLNLWIDQIIGVVFLCLFVFQVVSVLIKYIL